MTDPHIQNADSKLAMRVSRHTICINLLLTILKLLAGLIAQSSAMISDAIHSGSDVFSTLIVMIGVHISGRKARWQPSVRPRAAGVSSRGPAVRGPGRHRPLDWL